MNTRGRHLLVEYTGCDMNVLDDLKLIQTLMNDAAIAARANIVASVFQPFVPQGVTGVVVVEESHLSIHTWPEYGYAAVDFYTCGDSMPELAHEVIAAGLKAQYSELMHVERGFAVPGRGIQLRSHYTEVNDWPDATHGSRDAHGDHRPDGRAELSHEQAMAPFIS